MSLLEAAVVGLGLWLVSLLIWMLYTGLPALLEVLRRPTTPIARLTPGEVEIEGVIEADHPLSDASKKACAMVHVSYRGTVWEQQGKHVTARVEERAGTLVGGGLSVRDRTGVCRLLVSAELLEVSAPPRTTNLDEQGAQRLLTRSPSYEPIVTPRGQVNLVELPIRVGQRVLVSGEAIEDDEASPDGYREGAGRAFVIRAAAERKLLVSAGRQSDLVVRAAMPLALAVAMVGAYAWLAWKAWAIRQGVG